MFEVSNDLKVADSFKDMDKVYVKAAVKKQQQQKPKVEKAVQKKKSEEQKSIPASAQVQ